MREIWNQSLCWEDPLKKGMAAHSSFLAWRIPWTISYDHKESDMTEWLLLSFFTKWRVMTCQFSSCVVVRMTSNEPVHWGWRSLWYKVLSRTPSMSVKSAGFAWWGFRREPVFMGSMKHGVHDWAELTWERVICMLSHKGSNKIKGGEILSQQGARSRELT